MYDHFNRTRLFIGRVLSVKPSDYTITVNPVASRMGMRNVRVIVPNSGNVRGKLSGFSWMPHVGDWAVCGFIEGYPDFPVCFGVIYNGTNTRPPEAGTIDGEYQFYDYVVQHQTGSFIRIRNRNQPYQDSSGNWHEPETDLPKVTIQQLLADKKSVNEIELDEPVAGKSTITVTHHTGAKLKIDEDGNVIVIPANGKKIKLGSDNSGESLILGDSFKEWINKLISSKLEIHTHPTGVGPTGKPIEVPFGEMPDSLLSIKTKTER